MGSLHAVKKASFEDFKITSPNPTVTEMSIHGRLNTHTSLGCIEARECPHLV